jgi:ferredoxin
MAFADQKVAENISGAVFVDTQCIDCDLCRTKVPEVFKRSDNGYSFVYEQPSNDEVLGRTREVISECPVEAIGEQN